MSSSSSSSPFGYFCHQCNVAIQTVTNTFTCPRCQSGFVEQLEGPFEAAGARDAATPMRELQDFLTDPMIVFGGPPGAGPDGPPNPHLGHFFHHVSQAMDPGGARSRHPRATVNVRAGPQEQIFGGPADYANQGPLLQELLNNIATMVNMQHGGGGPANIQMLPGFQMYGNPGDYAWGRGGLDAIVTQLLNQMDGTGPPPLQGEVIEKIPTVKVTQQQIDEKLQCSVCWEDFKLSEDVRQLNCDHIYHEPCILPWLELHGTCPVCRKSQQPEDGGSGGQGADGAGASAPNDLEAGNEAGSSLGNAISSVFNLLGWPSSNSTSTTPEQQQPPRSSSSSSSGSAPPPPAAPSSTASSSAGTRNNRQRGDGGREARGGGGTSGGDFKDFDLE